MPWRHKGGIVHAGLALGWQIVRVGDLNGDGQADLVFRHTQTGDVAGWLMNGLVRAQGAIIWSGLATAWQTDGVADLNGDGRADLVFRNAETGDVAGWLMKGLSPVEEESFHPGCLWAGGSKASATSTEISPDVTKIQADSFRVLAGLRPQMASARYRSLENPET